jgi:hypothetical protein
VTDFQGISTLSSESMPRFARCSIVVVRRGTGAVSAVCPCRSAISASSHIDAELFIPADREFNALVAENGAQQICADGDVRDSGADATLLVPLFPLW